MSRLREFMERRDVIKGEHAASTQEVPPDGPEATANGEAWTRFLTEARLDPDEASDIAGQMGQVAAMDVLRHVEEGRLSVEGLGEMFAGIWLDGLVVGRTFEGEGS